MADNKIVSPKELSELESALQKHNRTSKGISWIIIVLQFIILGVFATVLGFMLVKYDRKYDEAIASLAVEVHPEVVHVRVTNDRQTSSESFTEPNNTTPLMWLNINDRANIKKVLLNVPEVKGKILAAWPEASDSPDKVARMLTLYQVVVENNKVFIRLVAQPNALPADRQWEPVAVRVHVMYLPKIEYNPSSPK